MQIEEFIVIKIKDLAELYSKNLSPNTIAIYIEDLKEFTKEQIFDAMAAHRRDPNRGRFFPYPSDLISQIKKNDISSDNQNQLDAENAWDELMDIIKKEGRYAKPEFSSKITEEIVNKMGGYISFCNMPLSEVNKTREYFIKKFVFRSKLIVNVDEHIDNTLNRIANILFG